MSAPPADDAPHLLVVDDDARLRSLLSRYLMRDGYRVSTAASAAQARALLDIFLFDLIVLDVMMPGETGLAFAGALRAGHHAQAHAPILMLTARAGARDRIEGLEAGVDDYLAKPFEPRELALRVAAILRRAAAAPLRAPALEEARFGAFVFDLASGMLRRDGAPAPLSAREREMLTVLARAGGGPVERAALAGPETSARTIDVQINRLRRKIEADPANPLYLQTVRGIGYRLAMESPFR